MDEVKEIPLTKGVLTLIDQEDFERVIQFKWTYNPKGYAYKNIYPIIDGKKRRKVLYLHRFILDYYGELEIDHINRNTLDNRKINLRISTDQQNHANEGLSKNNTSGFKGVSWMNNQKKWRAFIKVNYKQIHLGSYTDKFDAAQAYNDAAIKYFGQWARLNEV